MTRFSLNQNSTEKNLFVTVEIFGCLTVCVMLQLGHRVSDVTLRVRIKTVDLNSVDIFRRLIIVH